MKAVGELLKQRRTGRELVPREQALIAAALGPEGAEGVAGLDAERRGPGEAVEVAERRDPVELILGRALGADWLDRYLTAWRKVELEIDGDDLIAAGVPQGPAIGRGLRAARGSKPRRRDLGPRAGAARAALEAARDGDGVA